MRGINKEEILPLGAVVNSPLWLKQDRRMKSGQRALQPASLPTDNKQLKTTIR